MNLKVKNMIYCSMFACITAILAQIQISLPSLVPITLQTLGIYLIGLMLKPRIAAISSLIYVLMGAIGLPVYSGFSGGVGIVIGPTGGYIFSFIIMAVTISWIIKDQNKNYLKIIAMIIGTFICYLIGTAWFMYSMNSALIPALTMCVLPFLPGDILKIIIALVLSNKFRRIIQD